MASKLDSYLKEQLGVKNGLEETFNQRKVRQWIELGGAAEDEGFGVEPLGAAFRSINHFHNPLQSWDQAGLAGRCLAIIPISGEASVRWAQDPAQGLSGQAAWADARQAFLQALTLPSKAERDAAWAKTFQILGQQMRLVADLAAPAHTRNDPHCWADGFEAWASTNSRLVQDLLAVPPVRPDPSIFSLGVPIPDPIAKVPIARLWDTDQYVTPNPDPDIALSPTIGLAEYSNANSFSDGTVFSNDSTNLPFPAKTGVELGPPEPEPKKGELRRYLKKVRDGELIDHLAVPSALYDFLPEALQAEKKGLDDKVFQDYGEKLLPRAVGYSAVLLDYFFRGSLWARADWYGGKLVLYLSNEGDEIMEGVFEVYAIYDKGSAGERRMKLASREGGAVTTLQAGSSQTFQVDVPSGQGLTHHYILVFRGRLGDEEDAVVGHVFLLAPRVLFVQQESTADIKLDHCDRFVWPPDPGIPDPGETILDEEILNCWWTPVNRQMNGRLVKNVVDPIVKRIVARTATNAGGTMSATIWERQGAEPDPVTMTFVAPDSPVYWDLFLDVQLTDGFTISTRLATFYGGYSSSGKSLSYGYVDSSSYYKYAVESGKSASLGISRDRGRDKTISISGYTNPTNTLTVQSYGGFVASEGVVVDSDGYREYALTGLEVYQGGSTEPPKYDPRFAVALNAFNATPIGEGLPTKWEAVIERVYYRGEAEFLQAFMPDVPPPFTIHLSGPQQ
ncbi:MAG: hypothetical protein C3F08_08225 [Candidatus Methylomirabilota bacterium]|nr:MAG: hypothetical protein C3F08_08225 [candidate division NC10 bacterium]